MFGGGLEKLQYIVNLNGEKEMYKKDDSNHSDGTYHGSEEGEKKG